MGHLVAPLNRLMQFAPLPFRSTLCLALFIKARSTSLGLSTNRLLSYLSILVSVLLILSFIPSISSVENCRSVCLDPVDCEDA